MAQFQLGEEDDARESLERLRRMIPDQKHWGHFYEPEWVRQAEEMINGRTEDIAPHSGDDGN